MGGIERALWVLQAQLDRHEASSLREVEALVAARAELVAMRALLDAAAVGMSAMLGSDDGWDQQARVLIDHIEAMLKPEVT